MPAGSTACVKCTKKMNGITTSDKSISNGNGYEEGKNKDNNNDDHYQELDDDDSVS